MLFRSDTRDQLSVMDHASSGPFFTWSNKHHDGFLTRKLDRVFINGNWIAKIPHSTVEFLAPKVSDHCPALIMMNQDIASPPKPFKFFNF